MLNSLVSQLYLPERPLVRATLSQVRGFCMETVTDLLLAWGYFDSLHSVSVLTHRGR